MTDIVWAWLYAVVLIGVVLTIVLWYVVLREGGFV